LPNTGYAATFACRSLSHIRWCLAASRHIITPANIVHASVVRNSKNIFLRDKRMIGFLKRGRERDNIVFSLLSYENDLNINGKLI